MIRLLKKFNKLDNQLQDIYGYDSVLDSEVNSYLDKIIEQPNYSSQPAQTKNWYGQTNYPSNYTLTSSTDSFGSLGYDPEFETYFNNMLKKS